MEKLEFGNLDHIGQVKDYQRQADIEDTQEHLSELLCDANTTQAQDAMLDALNGNDVLNDEVDEIISDLDGLRDRLTGLLVS